MGWIKNLLLLAVVICSQNIRAQTKVLKPEEVFALYFDTFVKHDDSSLDKLNGYIKNFMGQDALYKNDMKTAYDEELKGLTSLFLSGFSENVQKECAPVAKDYFATLLDKFKTAAYTIKNIETMRNDYSQSQDVSEVFYKVTIKVPDEISALDLKNIKKITSGELKKYLQDLTAKLQNAKKEFSFEEKFNLYQFYRDDKVFYWNGGPQELLWKLNNFYFKNVN